MARLHTSFILGYHGCAADLGESILSGEKSIDGSSHDYDWLGPGIYFWESDPIRAWEWANWKVQRKDYQVPFVLGAVIDLGHCLDLMARDSLELVAEAYTELRKASEAEGTAAGLPQNKSAGSKDEDNLLRYLDCAVIRHLHAALADAKEPPFESVRGLFTEGGVLFPGSGFQRKLISR
jgi:hypothetical protein